MQTGICLVLGWFCIAFVIFCFSTSNISPWPNMSTVRMVFFPISDPTKITKIRQICPDTFLHKGCTRTDWNWTYKIDAFITKISEDGAIERTRFLPAWLQYLTGSCRWTDSFFVSWLSSAAKHFRGKKPVGFSIRFTNVKVSQAWPM